MKLRADTPRIGENLDCLGQHVLEAAEERQEQLYSEASVDRYALERLYFSCTSWVPLDYREFIFLSSLLIENLLKGSAHHWSPAVFPA